LELYMHDAEVAENAETGIPNAISTADANREVLVSRRFDFIKLFQDFMNRFEGLVNEL